jgi:uridine kinase
MAKDNDYGIKIVVMGRAGTGKTTVANLIKRYLDGLGFACTLSDDEYPGEPADKQMLPAAHMARKLSHLLSEPRPISIETRQAMPRRDFLKP